MYLSTTGTYLRSISAEEVIRAVHDRKAPDDAPAALGSDSDPDQFCLSAPALPHTAGTVPCSDPPTGSRHHNAAGPPGRERERARSPSRGFRPFVGARLACESPALRSRSGKVGRAGGPTVAGVSSRAPAAPDRAAIVSCGHHARMFVIDTQQSAASGMASPGPTWLGIATRPSGTTTAMSPSSSAMPAATSAPNATIRTGSVIGIDNNSVGWKSLLILRVACLGHTDVADFLDRESGIGLPCPLSRTASTGPALSKLRL